MRGKTVFFAVLFAAVSALAFAQQVIGAYDIAPGTYRMLEYPVNIRSQPGLNGAVIGRLQLHDRIEVLENTGNRQTIDGVLQNWYRIRSSGTEGYIWGGYIAVESFVFDIDNNGVDDYFYSRIRDIRDIKNPWYTGRFNPDDPIGLTDKEYYRTDFLTENDIFIYFNGTLVDTSPLRIKTDEVSRRTDYQFHSLWRRCSFSDSGDEVIIYIFALSNTLFVFGLDRTGSIRFGTVDEA